MQELVKPQDANPVVRFIDVWKTFKYHGGASRLGDADEEGLDDEEEQNDEGKLRPGETRTALRNINLAILPGESVGIIGTNGSGKSTLLRILSGLSLPTSGRVVGRGATIPLDQVMRPLNGSWDGRQNLRVLSRLLGFPARLVDERLDQIVSFAGIGDAVWQPVTCYSRGMYARLAYAAAMELSGDIYISDDVIGVGDQAFQAKCIERLQELCRSGKTVLFATHKLKLVEQICTRAILLESGEVRADGEAMSVTASYRGATLKQRLPASRQQENGPFYPGAGVPKPVEEWFKEKYGYLYPLPVPLYQLCRPVEDVSQADGGDPAVGGITGLECIHEGDLQQIISSNEIFLVKTQLDVSVGCVQVDITVEIYRTKMLLYQSFLDPIYVKVPQTLTFEFSIEGGLLPDRVYLIQIKALFTIESGERLMSIGDLYVATNNCGPEMPPRAHSFNLPGSPWQMPIRVIDLAWRVTEDPRPEKLES